jgi:hypothetical protein
MALFFSGVHGTAKSSFHHAAQILHSFVILKNLHVHYWTNFKLFMHNKNLKNNMKPQYIKIDQDGDKFYYSDRRMKTLHREDGPAIEWSDGDKEWCLNNKIYSEAEHTKRTAKEIVLTMDEIAAKFGVSVKGLKITK